MSEERAPWHILHSEFTRFLSERGRTGKCPVCPHYGDWTFHVVPSTISSGDPVMLVSLIPSYKPEKMDGPFARQGHLAMECPQCGFMQFTNIAAVARFLGRDFPEAKDD